MKKSRLLASSSLLTFLIFSITITPISAAYSSFAGNGTKKAQSLINSGNSTRISLFNNTNYSGTSSSSSTQAIAMKKFVWGIWYPVSYCNITGRGTSSAFLNTEKNKDFQVDIIVNGSSTYTGYIKTTN